MGKPDGDLRKLFKKLEEQGGRIKTTRKGWMVIPPDPAAGLVTIHGTPSDRRSWANMIADLRRSGFQV